MYIYIRMVSRGVPLLHVHAIKPDVHGTIALYGSHYHCNPFHDVGVAMIVLSKLCFRKPLLSWMQTNRVSNKQSMALHGSAVLFVMCMLVSVCVYMCMSITWWCFLLYVVSLLSLNPLSQTMKTFYYNILPCIGFMTGIARFIGACIHYQ